MNTVSSHDIKSVAELVWSRGYSGAAHLPVRIEYRLSRAESARIRDAFRSKLEPEIARLAAMPKRELNKMFSAPRIKISARLENENAGSEFCLEDYCPCRYVRGRQIRDVMTVEDVLNSKKAFSVWYPHGGDWHDSESYASLSPNESGTYDRVLMSAVNQGAATRGPRGFNRTKSKADFVRRVKEFVELENAHGWNLVATAVETRWGEKKPTLVFTKTVSEPSAEPAPSAVQSVECVCGSVPLDLSDVVGGRTFPPAENKTPTAEPEPRDLARISKLVEASAGDRSRAETKARAMNAKITDESKRARRAGACVRLGFEWLAGCFAA